MVSSKMKANYFFFANFFSVYVVIIDNEKIYPMSSLYDLPVEKSIYIIIYETEEVEKNI